MRGPILVLGAGAVGSYVGGMLSSSGEDVVLLDPWPAHIEAVSERGIVIETPEGTINAHPRALHLCDAHQIARTPPVLAFLCVKLYDIEWAATLLNTLVPTAPIVTMQNALVEETVARIVGWTRTLGAIASTLHVAMMEPGLVRRSRRRGSASPVFKVGELSGRATPRARAIAELLAKVDTATVTTQLWDDRWGKLVANAMISGLAAISGLPSLEIYRRDDARCLGVALAAEAFALGRELGFTLQPLFGIAAECWLAAASGERAALGETRRALEKQSETLADSAISGTLQDLLKNRRTEVDYFNGFIAAQGAARGVPTPTHALLADLIRSMESGPKRPGEQHLLALSLSLTHHSRELGS
jgi:2-dehydropantoate 2-reductase